MRIKKYIPGWIMIYIRAILHLVGRYARVSYSQEGEDLLLARYFGEKKRGFYVDVGAHHPSRFSNTYYFYKRGWRGINIDAQPGSMRLFRMMRPRDINLEYAIFNKEDLLEFHVFKEPLLNTADKQLAESRRAALGERENDDNVLLVHAVTLESVLDRFLPKGTSIEFMSIDVEGLDIEVLRSNNWDKYRPNYVLVEILGGNFDSLPHTDIGLLLSDVGYEPVAKLMHTVVFRDVSIGPAKYL